MSSKNKPFTSTFGVRFLSKARSVFLFGFMLVFLTTTAMVYAGVKTGELERRVVQPTREFARAFVQSFETEKKDTTTEEPVIRREINTSTTSEVDVEINNRGTNSGNTDEKQYYVYPTREPFPTYAFPTSSLPSYEERVRQMEEEFERKKQEGQDSLDQFREESEKRMEEFRKLSEKCRQEFMENEGTYVSDECKNR